ncbi:MAG: acyltransferase [Ruminococcus sp.]|nr:acyltransferase [Ruminococcus sp.]
MSYKSMSKNRVLSYDIIRIIAVLAVVMIHSSVSFVTTYPPKSTDFILGNVFDGISRIGVPLFIMLSGALMLDENKETPIKKMLKYALRIFMLLCIWSLLYAVVYQIIQPLIDKRSISVEGFWNAFAYGHYHLWYLYMLIGLYLITPILKAFVKKSNEKIVLYFIILAVIFQFAEPLINLLINQGTQTTDLLQKFIYKFRMGFVGQYTAYYLLGWYITNIKIKKTYRSCLYVLGFVGLFVTIMGTQLLINDMNKIYNSFYSDTSINVMCYSAAIFLFLYYFFKNKNYKRVNKISMTLSKLTFGVYLIHPYIITLLNKFINTKNALTQIPLNWIVATAGAFLITFILSKIPLLKKLVRC